MPTELTVLALAGLLQVVQIVLMSIPANMQLGTNKTGGPRDGGLELTGMAGQLHRAMNNHFEGLVLFTIAVVVVTLGEQSSAYTETCAWVYLGARVFYIPAYVIAISYLRTIVWLVGFGATVAMIAAALI
jgi:uncharacterized MAPEG superfamily protein